MNIQSSFRGLLFCIFLGSSPIFPAQGVEHRLIVVDPRDAEGKEASHLPANGKASRQVVTAGRVERVATITEAAALAGDGDIVEIRPGEYVAQPVVWTQKSLTIRGSGKRPVMLAGNAHAEGKAIWVIRNGNITIENIEFKGARVPDGNGAGIRFEKGHLTLRNCAFFDNEMGVLTSNFESATLDVIDSEFGDAPRHFSGALHHLLYVGTIGRFSLVGSRLHNGFRGHLVKSRARESHIAYNFLYDGPGGAASYELEFPNGGLATVIGNTIGQAATSDNATIVAYGAEGARWVKNDLTLIHNTLINEMQDGRFVDIWARKLPSDTEFVAFNNLLIGRATFPVQLRRPADGNVSLALANTIIRNGSVELSSDEFHRATQLPLATGSGKMPKSLAEFSFPVGTKPVGANKKLRPGAFQ